MTRRITGGCLSQFDGEADEFELLLSYADGKEIGHVINRDDARRLACGVLSDIEYVSPDVFRSAVDAVDALREMDAFWTESHPAGPDGDPSILCGRLADETLDVWRKIRAAITKAEGRA